MKTTLAILAVSFAHIACTDLQPQAPHANDCISPHQNGRISITVPSSEIIISYQDNHPQ